MESIVPLATGTIFSLLALFGIRELLREVAAATTKTKKAQMVQLLHLGLHGFFVCKEVLDSLKASKLADQGVVWVLPRDAPYR